MTAPTFRRFVYASSTAVATLALLALAPIAAPAQNTIPDELPPPPSLAVPGLDGEPVALHLDEVILTALAQNLDIRVQLAERSAAGELVLSEYGIYDPVLGASLSQARVDSPTVIDTGLGPVESAQYLDITRAGATLEQLTPLGTRITLEATQTRTWDRDPSGMGVSSLYNSAYDTGAGIRATQPLLKNFGPLVTNARIRIAQRQFEGANELFTAEVENRVAEVMRAYFELDFAIRNLAVQRQAVESAEELERVTRRRVDVGNLPRLSLIQAEAQVAARESVVVAAEARVIDAQDTLRQVLNWERGATSWNTPIQPAEPLRFAQVDIPDEEAIAIALERRPDLRFDRTNAEVAAISRDANRRQRLPELNAFAGYEHSGLDGNRGDAWSETRDGVYSGYNYGVELRYPLFNRQARGAYRQSLRQVDAAELRVENRELQVTREVRRATRAIRTSWRQMEATTRQVVADTEKLEVERRRLDVGERTIFDVLDFQDDLAESRAAQARAYIDYQIALVDVALSTGTLLDLLNITVNDEEERRGWRPYHTPTVDPAIEADTVSWVETLRTLTGRGLTP